MWASLRGSLDGWMGPSVVRDVEDVVSEGLSLPDSAISEILNPPSDHFGHSRLVFNASDCSAFEEEMVCRSCQTGPFCFELREVIADKFLGRVQQVLSLPEGDSKLKDLMFDIREGGDLGFFFGSTEGKKVIPVLLSSREGREALLVLFRAHEGAIYNFNTPKGQRVLKNFMGSEEGKKFLESLATKPNEAQLAESYSGSSDKDTNVLLGYEAGRDLIEVNISQISLNSLGTSCIGMAFLKSFLISSEGVRILKVLLQNPESNKLLKERIVKPSYGAALIMLENLLNPGEEEDLGFTPIISTRCFHTYNATCLTKRIESIVRESFRDFTFPTQLLRCPLRQSNQCFYEGRVEESDYSVNTAYIEAFEKWRKEGVRPIERRVSMGDLFQEREGEVSLWKTIRPPELIGKRIGDTLTDEELAKLTPVFKRQWSVIGRVSFVLEVICKVVYVIIAELIFALIYQFSFKKWSGYKKMVGKYTTDVLVPLYMRRYETEPLPTLKLKGKV